MLFGLAKSLERQFGARITADAEEQWLQGELPVGTEFDVDSFTDLEKILPDCGYQLRSVELRATGKLTEVDCDDCTDGKTTVLVVAGGGARLELSSTPAEPGTHVELRGSLNPPYDGHVRLEVTETTKQ